MGPPQDIYYTATELAEFRSENRVISDLITDIFQFLAQAAPMAC